MMRKRGVALVTILIVAAALLAIVSIGLRLGSEGVLFSSQAHKRNVALAAAEAGVYEAIERLQVDKNFSGAANATLEESGASFEIRVDNNIASAGVAEVVSTGIVGSTRRTLKVELEADASNFQSISLGGKVYVYERVYANGISGTQERLVRPGHIHSQYASGVTYQGQDYEGRSIPAELHATGDLTTRSGSLKSDLGVTAATEASSVNRQPYELDRDRMLQDFDRGSAATAVGPGNVVSSDTLLTGDQVFANEIVLENGATLHIEGGYAEFLGGVRGDGQVVVDRDVVIRAGGNFDPAVEGGIRLYSNESVLLVHPEVSTDDDGFDIPRDQNTAVGDYFAEMPMEAVYEMPTGLPLDAPRGVEFFEWFHANMSGSPSQEFSLWLDGNNTELYPGLSQATKDWLEKSASYVGAMTQWANSGGNAP